MLHILGLLQTVQGRLRKYSKSIWGRSIHFPISVHPEKLETSLCFFSQLALENKSRRFMNFAMRSLTIGLEIQNLNPMALLNTMLNAADPVTGKSCLGECSTSDGYDFGMLKPFEFPRPADHSDCARVLPRFQLYADDVIQIKDTNKKLLVSLTPARLSLLSS